MHPFHGTDSLQQLRFTTLCDMRSADETTFIQLIRDGPQGEGSLFQTKSRFKEENDLLCPLLQVSPIVHREATGEDKQVSLLIPE